jgi:hypothetical protein
MQTFPSTSNIFTFQTIKSRWKVFLVDSNLWNDELHILIGFSTSLLLFWVVGRFSILDISDDLLRELIFTFPNWSFSYCQLEPFESRLDRSKHLFNFQFSSSIEANKSLYLWYFKRKTSQKFLFKLI